MLFSAPKAPKKIWDFDPFQIRFLNKNTFLFLFLKVADYFMRSHDGDTLIFNDISGEIQDWWDIS